MVQVDPGVLAGRRLLVVEDEYLLADFIQREFERAGAILVGPAASVDDALGLLRDSDVLDGAVLDVNLRGQAVFPVADVLRQRGVPFVFATGYGASHLPIAYREIVCVQKPVEPEEVAEALFG